MRHPSRLSIPLACWSAMILVWGLGALTLKPAGALQRFDEEVLRWFYAVRTERLDSFFSTATDAGSPFFLQSLGAVIAVLLLLRRRKREALFVTLGIFGSGYLAGAVKLIVARPRPHLFPVWYPAPSGFSFPSIHAAQIVGFVLSLLWIMRLHRGKVPPAYLLTGAGMVALVSASRLYLQVHFLSDVLAGMIAATLWIAGLASLLLPETSAQEPPDSRGS